MQLAAVPLTDHFSAIISRRFNNDSWRLVLDENSCCRHSINGVLIDDSCTESMCITVFIKFSSVLLHLSVDFHSFHWSLPNLAVSAKSFNLRYEFHLWPPEHVLDCHLSVIEFVELLGEARLLGECDVRLLVYFLQNLCHVLYVPGLCKWLDDGISLVFVVVNEVLFPVPLDLQEQVQPWSDIVTTWQEARQSFLWDYESSTRLWHRQQKDNHVLSPAPPSPNQSLATSWRN